MYNVKNNLVFVEYNKIYTRYQEDFASVNMPHLHFHEGYEIYIMLKGSVEYTISDEVYPLGNGSFILVKPYTIHKKISISNKYTTFLVQFNREVMLKYLTQEATDNILDIYNTNNYGLIENDKIESVLLLIDIIQKSRTEEQKLMYIAKLLSVLFTCMELNPKKGINERRAISLESRISSFVLNNLDKKISLELLSKKLYLSKQNIILKLKKELGITPMRLVNAIKMDFARTMIFYRDFTIDRISRYCGYKSAAYFTKTFKSIYGITPSEYKRRFHKNE